MLKNLSPQEVKSLLGTGKITLIDVREPNEYANERIHGALLYPLSTFDVLDLPEATPDKPLVFHCGAGVRSAKAVAACEAAGLAHHQHMQGGMGAWKAAGLPYLKLDLATGQLCEQC